MLTLAPVCIQYVYIVCRSRPFDWAGLAAMSPWRSMPSMAQLGWSDVTRSSPMIVGRKSAVVAGVEMFLLPLIAGFALLRSTQAIHAVRQSCYRVPSVQRRLPRIRPMRHHVSFCTGIK